MKYIEKIYEVVFDEATTLKNIPYKDWRREKYIGKEGILLIVKRNKSQYIQFHPKVNKQVVYKKGLVSSDDDIVIEKKRIIVKTQNSYYYFTIKGKVNT